MRECTHASRYAKVIAIIPTADSRTDERGGSAARSGMDVWGVQWRTHHALPADPD